MFLVFTLSAAIGSRREEFYPNRIEPILKSVCNDPIPEIASLGKFADQMIKDGKLKIYPTYGEAKCNRLFYTYKEDGIYYITASIADIRRTYMCSGNKRFTDIIIRSYTHEIYHIIYDLISRNQNHYKPSEIMADLVIEESWVTAEHIINVVRPMMEADRIDDSGSDRDNRRFKKYNDDPCNQKWLEYIMAKDLQKQILIEETAVIGRPVKPRK